MKIITYSLLLIFVIACGSTKNTPVSTPEPSAQSLPSWLVKRPLTTTYYIGISRVSKKRFPTNFSDEAKKSALDDLSQEIEVKVETNSILYTFSKNDSHKEDFVQSIKLESKVDLENYELVDSYETDTEYAIYYRLNKAEYQAWKKSLENKQIEIAKSWLQKAQQPNTSLTQEIAFKLKAMEAIKEYWNEPLKTEIDQKEVFFGNYVLSEIQGSLNKIQISMNKESLRLPYGLNIPDNLLIASASNNGSTINELPLIVRAANLTLDANQYTTNGKGQASIKGIKCNEPKNINLKVEVDLDRISSISDEVKMAVKSGLNLPSSNCIIQYETPRVYIKTSPLGNGILNELKTTLTGISLLNENNKNKADLICDISIGKREGGEYNGLFTSFLDIEIKVTEKNNQMYYTKKYIGIKGVDLSYDRAITKALESFKSKFTYEFAPQLKKKLKE